MCNQTAIDSDMLASALGSTGFEVCEFGPDDDPCDHCGKRQRQLYFGNRDYWNSSDGDYYCAVCVVELHQDNEICKGVSWDRYKSIIETAIVAANRIMTDCEFCDGGPVGEFCDGCAKAYLEGILRRCNLGCGELYDVDDEIHCSCWQTHAVDSCMTAEEVRDWEEEHFRKGAE